LVQSDPFGGNKVGSNRRQTQKTNVERKKRSMRKQVAMVREPGEMGSVEQTPCRNRGQRQSKDRDQLPRVLQHVARDVAGTGRSRWRNHTQSRGREENTRHETRAGLVRDKPTDGPTLAADFIRAQGLQKMVGKHGRRNKNPERHPRRKRRQKWKRARKNSRIDRRGATKTRENNDVKGLVLGKKKIRTTRAIANIT